MRKLGKPHAAHALKKGLLATLTACGFSHVFYAFVFAYYLMGCGMRGVEMIFLYWATFLAGPLALTVWAIVRVARREKCNDWASVAISTISIGIAIVYAFQMTIHYPKAPNYWWCGS